MLFFFATSSSIIAFAEDGLTLASWNILADLQTLPVGSSMDNNGYIFYEGTQMSILLSVVEKINVAHSVFF